MRALKVLVVLAVLVTATAAYCQSFGGIIWSAGELGMGGTQIAVPDGAHAWGQNPAGIADPLAWRDFSPMGEAVRNWVYKASAMGSFSGDDGTPRHDLKIWDVSLGAFDKGRDLGFGAGYWHQETAAGIEKHYGVGYGQKICSDNNLYVGATIQRSIFPGYSYAFAVAPAVNSTLSSGLSKTVCNLGAMYNVAIPDKAPIRFGLVVNDVSDQILRQWNAGVAFNPSSTVLVAADLYGIGSQNFRRWAVGAQWNCKPEWVLRAGDGNGILTAGVGWKHNNFCLDYGHAQKGGGKFNLVSASVCF